MGLRRDKTAFKHLKTCREWSALCACCQWGMEDSTWTAAVTAWSSCKEKAGQDMKGWSRCLGKLCGLYCSAIWKNIWQTGKVVQAVSPSGTFHNAMNSSDKSIGFFSCSSFLFLHAIRLQAGFPRAFVLWKDMPAMQWGHEMLPLLFWPPLFPWHSQLQRISRAHSRGWRGLFPGGGGDGVAVQLRARAFCTRSPAPAQHRVWGTGPARVAVQLHPRWLLTSENIQWRFHSSVFLYQICTISCVCAPHELPDGKSCISKVMSSHRAQKRQKDDQSRDRLSITQLAVTFCLQCSNTTSCYKLWSDTLLFARLFRDLC